MQQSLSSAASSLAPPPLQQSLSSAAISLATPPVQQCLSCAASSRFPASSHGTASSSSGKAAAPHTQSQPPKPMSSARDVEEPAAKAANTPMALYRAALPPRHQVATSGSAAADTPVATTQAHVVSMGRGGSGQGGKNTDGSVEAHVATTAQGHVATRGCRGRGQAWVGKDGSYPGSSRDHGGSCQAGGSGKGGR